MMNISPHVGLIDVGLGCACICMSNVKCLTGPYMFAEPGAALLVGSDV